MNSNPTSLLVLQPGQALRLQEAGSWQVTVERGELWLTESGWRVDHFLSAGQTLVTDARHQPVAESNSGEAALITLQPVSRAASSVGWRVAIRDALMRRLKQALEARRQRRRAAQDERLLLELGEHQLRDIGAPPSMLWAAQARAESRKQWVEQYQRWP